MIWIKTKLFFIVTVNIFKRFGQHVTSAFETSKISERHFRVIHVYLKSYIVLRAGTCAIFVTWIIKSKEGKTLHERQNYIYLDPLSRVLCRGYHRKYYDKTPGLIPYRQIPKIHILHRSNDFRYSHDEDVQRQTENYLNEWFFLFRLEINFLGLG